MGDDLHGLAEELAAALLVDHRLVNLAGGVIRVPRERAVGEALVVAQVEVRFAAVVEHVDLAVLIGAHRARVDVDVRVELLHADLQAAMLQQHPDRCAGEPLTEGADHPAGDKDVLRHDYHPGSSDCPTRVRLAWVDAALGEPDGRQPTPSDMPTAACGVRAATRRPAH